MYLIRYNKTGKIHRKNIKTAKYKEIDLYRKDYLFLDKRLNKRYYINRSLADISQKYQRSFKIKTWL